MSQGRNTIWILAQHREGVFDDATFGLIAEARRLSTDLGGEAPTTVVVLGSGLTSDRLQSLGHYGTDELLYVEGEFFEHYRGECFASALCGLLERELPAFFLMVESEETADLAPRIAARLEAGLINRIADLKIDENGTLSAARPIQNGYLFQDVLLENVAGPVLLSYLPAVLSADEPEPAKEAVVRTELWNPSEESGTKLLEVVEADPEDLGVDEAEIVVSGGRGVGKGEAFQVVHELAACIGGTVGGTRPVIDAGTLPFERQIGQTGKSVAPRLIFNCGVSGANEYTAGMEKSQAVIAVNNDPRARIFQFADLGIVGDVHEVLPLLISRIKETKE